ncbi:MAG TPA: 6,7-dimethyl-8-ribityllumazine synthase [Terriglobales bacterium]|nr:6,7-dimethyl-8-ribityllumazine synthase [Terriglobales bacterium]
MIRSIHKLLVATSHEDYRALTAFFEALGVFNGETWDGERSRGSKFNAPDGGVEVGFGRGFPDADLVIEVDNADVTYDIAQRRGLPVVQEISDVEWGARLFLLEMPAGAGRLAIFSYKEAHRNKSLEGELDARGLRFAVVLSRFNAFITERLLAGALDTLHRMGANQDNVEIVRVPGAFEIPNAARTLAQSGKYDAVICLGCLLRGDTLHYEVIANEVARGIGQSAQETGVPHAFGVLTCDTLEQAIDRAGLKAGNKGVEAALAAVEMARLKKKVLSR